MAINPYAPPSSNIDGGLNKETAPELWNPNAAANWCLLFSVAFGAFLHMKNWQALGEHKRAASAKVWVIISAVVVVGFVLITSLFPENKGVGALLQMLTIAFLFAWYFGSARAQAKFVKERFGDSYPRKGWGKPILIVVGLIFGAFIISGFIAAAVIMISGG